MVHVVRHSGESQKQMLNRFRRKVAKSGVLRKARQKRWFVSKSEKRRIARKKAIRREHRRRRRKRTRRYPRRYN